MFHFKNNHQWMWIFMESMSEHMYNKAIKYNNTKDESGYSFSGYARIINFDSSKRITSVFEGHIENSEPSRIPAYGRKFDLIKKHCEVGYFKNAGGIPKLSGKGMVFSFDGSVKLEGIFAVNNDMPNDR